MDCTDRRRRCRQPHYVLRTSALAVSVTAPGSSACRVVVMLAMVLVRKPPAADADNWDVNGGIARHRHTGTNPRKGAPLVRIKPPLKLWIGGRGEVAPTIHSRPTPSRSSCCR